jgi:dTDP-4-amino-4,6-dideoxyglucose formyltransferase
MAGDMNVLVLCDNQGILEKAKPIFEKRLNVNWTIKNSDELNPKKEFQYIIDNFQLVISLHCKRIFPKKLVEGVRCVNVHPGYNPFNRGIFPHVFSIINEKPAGATIHVMDEQIDHGPIICQRRVGVTKTDTSDSLYSRVVSAELEILDNYLDLIISGKYEAHWASGTGNYNSMDDYKALCRFDPDQWIYTKDFFNRARALSHEGFWNAHIGDVYFKIQTTLKQ